MQLLKMVDGEKALWYFIGCTEDDLERGRVTGTY